MKLSALAGAALTAAVLGTTLTARDAGAQAGAVAAPGNGQQPGPVWPKLSAAERDQVMKFGEDFKQFIGTAKSAITFVREATKMVEAAGFKPWPKNPTKAQVTPGSRWYAVNRDRTIVAFVIAAAVWRARRSATAA